MARLSLLKVWWAFATQGALLPILAPFALCVNGTSSKRDVSCACQGGALCLLACAYACACLFAPVVSLLCMLWLLQGPGLFIEAASILVHTMGLATARFFMVCALSAWNPALNRSSFFCAFPLLGLQQDHLLVCGL
jgi:hypothetical protein